MAIDADLNCQVLFLDCARKEEDARRFAADLISGAAGSRRRNPRRSRALAVSRALCRRSLFCTPSMVVFWPTLPEGVNARPAARMGR